MRKKAACMLLSICIIQAQFSAYAQDTVLPAGFLAAAPPAGTISADTISSKADDFPDGTPGIADTRKKTSGRTVSANTQQELPDTADHTETADTDETEAQENTENFRAYASGWLIDEMISNSFAWIRRDNSAIMNEKFQASVSSTYTDWKAFNLGRLCIGDNYEGFLNAADLYVRSQYAAHPGTGLSRDSSTATEAHRLALAVLAAGGDPTHIGGQDLIADGTYNCLTGEPWKQGTNGAAWALLALDSRGYEPPAGAAYTREDLISYLLAHEIRGGGWAVDPASSTPGADITGAVVTSLAPYWAGNGNVRNAVNRAFDFFRKKMKQGGELEDSESTAWAATAYASAGIDPASVTSSSGKNLLDGLKKYYNEKTGGFYHSTESIASSDMATDQVIYSLIAYQRFLSGGTNLFDFRNPANTAQYLIQTDSGTYGAEAGDDAEIILLPGTSKIQITNLPIGSYDAAEVTAGGRTFHSSFRRADGSTPVNGTIAIADGDILSIQVSRRDGSSEAWRLSIQMSADAKVRAVNHKIASLPEPAALQLSDETAVNEAKKAYDALTDSEKAEVADYGKLEQALAQIQKQKQEEEKQQTKKRSEIKKKIEAIKSPARISGKAMINQYLLELEKLQEWEEKASLKNKLEKYRRDIAKREAVVETLDQDIWEQISPLWLSQKDTKTVKRLMTRYAALYKEEQALLGNKSSLLEAAGIIDSLSDAVIPARIFQNLQTTKGKFTYSGTLGTGAAYTLTFNGKTIQSAKKVNARVRCPGTKAVENAAACIEFRHKGSLNGTATFRTKLNVEDGTYHLYWYNQEKSTVQSAKTARVIDGELSMKVSTGGKYWLSKGVVRLSGQAPASAKTAAPASPAPIQSASPTAAARPGNGAAPGSASQPANAAGNNSDPEPKTVTVKGKNGIIPASEFEKITGKDRNLKVKGTLEDGITYSLTFHGEDITKAEDFPYEIKPDCENSDFIRQLGDRPLILCMEKMEQLPGEMLVSIQAGLEDGTYLLFVYNPEEMKAEYVKKAEVTNGSTRFILSEGGDYFIAKRAKAGSLLEPEDTEGTDSIDTGNSGGIGRNEDGGLASAAFRPFPWTGIAKNILAAIIGLGIGVCGACFYKKRKGRDPN